MTILRFLYHMFVYMETPLNLRRKPETRQNPGNWNNWRIHGIPQNSLVRNRIGFDSRRKLQTSKYLFTIPYHCMFAIWGFLKTTHTEKRKQMVWYSLKLWPKLLGILSLPFEEHDTSPLISCSCHCHRRYLTIFLELMEKSIFYTRI